MRYHGGGTHYHDGGCAITQGVFASRTFRKPSTTIYPILCRQSGCLIDVGMSARQTGQIIEISRQPDSESVVGPVGLLTTLTAAGLQAPAIAAPPPVSRPGPSAGRKKANTQTAVNLKRTVAKVARGKDRARKKAIMASSPSGSRQATTIGLIIYFFFTNL